MNRVLLVILIASILIGGIIFLTNSKNTPSVQKAQVQTIVNNNSRNQYSRLNCQLNDLQPREDFMPTYIVKRGDTLISVARDQLGSPDRAEELARLNQLEQHPELSLTTPFLEVGWKLLLPPKEIKKSSGQISVVSGEFIRQGNEMPNVFWFRTRQINSVTGDEPIYTNPSTVFKAGGLEIGKCYNIVYDTNSPYGAGSNALLITSQN